MGDEVKGLELNVKLPDVKPFSKKVSMSMEKEMLGVYLSEHPLNDYVNRMRRLSSITCEDLAHAEEDMANGQINTKVRDNMKCSLCGIVTTRKTQITKSGSMMAFIGIEDLYGTAEIVVFPKVYERVSALTEVDRVINIRGTLNFKEDEAPKILADDITEIMPDEAMEEIPSSESVQQKSFAKEKSAEATPDLMIKIRIPSGMDNSLTMDMIKTSLTRHMGEELVRVLIYLPSKRTVKQDMLLELTDSLRNQLMAILGTENVKF